MTEQDQRCEICDDDADTYTCSWCEGSGDRNEYGDVCDACGGRGEVTPDHCCYCGGSPYCNRCHQCGAECAADCNHPAIIQLADGRTHTL
ncbi:hypothetical protein [Actinomadura flavalba]|uniref:hypothetical protein n=1 Tax=Actinomadura flavalba TaxID=1120938 RepID=UPI00037280DF|nr:hypothetical protein [Actinomadura flavalba]